MRERACKNCGGKKYEVVGQNMVKCMFCGTLYVDEQGSKDEEFLLARANDLLRDLQFAKAIEQFDKIVNLFPMSFEGFFGLALAKHKIVLYPDKTGLLTRPCFFGEKIDLLQEDESVQKALSLAPAERAKTFREILQSVQDAKTQYDALASKQSFDVILCVDGQDAEKVAQLKEEIQKICQQKKLSVFDAGASEEMTFRAVETAKVFVCVLLNEQSDAVQQNRDLFDEYFHQILLHKKTRSSFVLCINGKKVKLSRLPKNFSQSINVLEVYSISFLQDLDVRLSNECKNSEKELARIDTIKIQKANPQRKEYVDVESISPVELGSFNVENVAATAESKKKMIFLALKNGDFATAQSLAKKELEADPYNSELLFAALLADKGIRTVDDFFAKLSNFSDKERLGDILRYANKDFAEDFVDRWEGLVQQADDEESYNQYFQFLVSFKTPNREKFIAAAQDKAVETLNPQLIENVEKCFGADEVDRFVQFYFLLAQKSDDKKYYQKILQLDAGHEESNIVLMLRKFKTPTDKLTYRERAEVENMLKFLEENSRVAFVSAVVEMVLPIAFFNLQEAEKQLDFYLAYIQDKAALISLLKRIASQFQQMQFFQAAEKYFSIAISKMEDLEEQKTQKTELFWELIKTKCHCRTDEELVMSQLRPIDLPEWETLLAVGDDQHDEAYGAIVSKNNMFSGKRVFAPNMMDKVELKEKLQAFLQRNNNVLLEIEKQEGAAVKKGVDYFALQMQPFEKYLPQIDQTEDFASYCDLVSKISDRLAALDLSLESSISVLGVQERAGGMQNVEISASPSREYESAKQSQKQKQFLKNFFAIFLEFFPLAFSALLFVLSIFLPKSAYAYFSQTSLIILLIFSLLLTGGNLLYWLIKRKTLTKGRKAILFSLVGLGIVNLLAFLLTFYVLPGTISISDVGELQTLLKNAPYCNFVLQEDLDFAETEWTPLVLHGTLDGKKHSLSNLSDALLSANYGTVRGVSLEVDMQIDDASTFGILAYENFGTLEDCFVGGKLSLSAGEIVGGLVGKNHGNVTACQSSVEIVIQKEGDAVAGGLIGENEGGKNGSEISKCSFLGSLQVECTRQATVGGLIGKESGASQIFECFSSGEISVSDAVRLTAGGLVGSGKSASHDNFARGTITATDITRSSVGGLCGSYSNSHISEKITNSYAALTIQGVPAGALVGSLGGRMENCFAVGELPVYGSLLQPAGGVYGCEVCDGYDPKFRFDDEIWDLSTFLPTFVWQNAGQGQDG